MNKKQTPPLTVNDVLTVSHAALKFFAGRLKEGLEFRFAELDVSPHTAYRYLKELKDAGIINVERHRRGQIKIIPLRSVQEYSGPDRTSGRDIQVTDEQHKDSEYSIPREEVKTYSIDDIAKRWEMNREKIRRLALNGELQMFRVGSQYRIREDVLENFELNRTRQTQKS